MASGILSAILDTTGKRVDERLAESQQMDQEMRDTQTKALLQSIYATDDNGQPKLSPAQQEEAWGRIEKLHSHNKGAKDILGKARDITEKIFTASGGKNKAMLQRQQTSVQQGLQDSGSNAPTTMGQPEDNMGMGPNNPPPITTSDTGAGVPPAPYTPPPPVRKQPVQQVAAAAPQTSTAQLIRAGAPPNPLVVEKAKGQVAMDVENAKAASNERIARIRSDKPPQKVGTYVGEDKQQHTMYVDWSKVDENGHPYTFEIDSKGEIAPARSWPSGKVVSGREAKERAARGEVFKGIDGKPIDMSSVNDDEELALMAGGLVGTYMRATQPTRQMTVNNQVTTYPAYDPQAQTVQGLARTGSTTVREEQAVDAEGNPVAMPLKSQNTPITPVAKTPAAATTAPVAPVTNAGPSTNNAGPITSGTRPLPAFNRTERANQLNVARPVRAAAVQLFGSPDDPNIESLESFAKLADNPSSRIKVGTAARLIINDLASADANGGGIGASVLDRGVNINGGDLWTAIKNTTGMTNWVASTQVKATQAAVDALSPDEARMLNQIIAAYGTVVGLRTLTRGGAYRFSVASMERELPIPGLSDVKDSTTYYNKMAKLANEIVEGAKGVSDQILPEKTFYKQQAQRLNLLGQGKNPNAPQGPTPPPNRSTSAQERVRVIGPDGKTGTVVKGTKLPDGWKLAQ